ncbi:hypothetical protein DFP72DRAFT_867532 [Ephemerocybe angulata]|uniref:Uncharacterized protein n=1 Tax=Ephemerocybe angulata TaxID=980116 RepID=A0A8H6IJF6_9AGAR|nr:hypothetical protein DFP72DRAFT_867532 [Tulosesus angulatus]
MPELVEGLAHCLVVQWGLQLYGDGPFPVLNLYADLTGTEADDAKITTGLVQQLNSSCEMRRGTCGNQTPLLADELCGDSPLPITALSLRQVHYSVRAMVLDLGPLWLKLAYLTHTSVQVYPKSEWTVISKVPKSNRKFSVALGIECERFVLAFLSLDQLFQPIWASSRSGLGPEPVYVAGDFLGFLKGVAAWIEMNWAASRMNLAAAAIRDANHVWVGVGAYTVNEIFFLAGIPMGIRERDLFGNPSRTARLCVAYLALAMRAERELPSLLRPAWHKGMLAPDSDDRKKYPDRMLHIYGKDRVFLPSRLVDLANEHNRNVAELRDVCDREDIVWWRSEWTDVLPDPYEPAYVQEVFKAPNGVQLGHLVYGSDEWGRIEAHFGFPEATMDDPLTLLYQKLGVLETEPTYLRPVDPPSLFSDLKNRADRRAFRPFALQTSKKGILWSLIDMYPENSKADAEDKFRAQVNSVNPSEHTFASKSTEDGVSVGPMEYCSNPRRYASGKREVVVPVRGHLNPALSDTDIKRLVTKSWRKEYEKRERAKITKRAVNRNEVVRDADLNAVSHSKLSARARQQRDKRVQAALREVRNLFGDERQKQPQRISGCSVKHRGSSDRDIAREGKENMDSESSASRTLRTRSSKSRP